MQVLINETHNTTNGNCSSDSAVPIDPEYQTIAEDNKIQEQNVQEVSTSRSKKIEIFMR